MITKFKNNVLWDEQAANQYYVVEPLGNMPPKVGFDRIKRMFDAIVSFVCILIFLLPMAMIAAIIAIESRGNPIYLQTRLGKDEKPFCLLKFRSMFVGAEDAGLRWAEAEDERVTRIGRWIRKTRIDELPQLFNILVGQMSFVGPRPERPEFYDVFDTYIEGFRQRMVVLPGLTGLAQVNGGYDLRPEEKIIYDMQYIRERSVKTDLICLLKTVGVIFGRKGAR